MLNLDLLSKNFPQGRKSLDSPKMGFLALTLDLCNFTPPKVAIMCLYNIS